MTRYDGIIRLAHHISDKRPLMSMHDRAAQFSSFAALTGYDDAVRETARLTDSRPELGRDALEILDLRLNMLEQKLPEHPALSVTFFRADGKKQGGMFVTLTGEVKRIDEAARRLVFINGESIPIADIVELDGAIFSEAEGELR